jgi:hypothetical protein
LPIGGHEAAQVFRQGCRARVAFARLLLQAFQTDGFQIPRAGRLQLDRRHRLLPADLLERLQERRALEGRAAGEQLVEDGSQRVDVRDRTDLLDLALGVDIAFATVAGT